MKLLKPTIWQVLGVLTNGDMGPYTFYQSSRGRLVMFLKTWPKDPATYHQTLYRNRWRHAGVRWRNLDQSTRDLWEQISKRGNCTVTGYNLYMYYMLDKNRKVIETLQRQTNLDAVTPTGEPLPRLPR